MRAIDLREVDEGLVDPVLAGHSCVELDLGGTWLLVSTEEHQLLPAIDLGDRMSREAVGVDTAYHQPNVVRNGRSKRNTT